MNTKIAIIIPLISILSTQVSYAGDGGKFRRNSDPSVTLLTQAQASDDSDKKARHNSPQTAKKPQNLAPLRIPTIIHDSNQSPRKKPSAPTQDKTPFEEFPAPLTLAPGASAKLHAPLPLSASESAAILATFNMAYTRAQQQKNKHDSMQDDAIKGVNHSISKEPDCIPMDVSE